MKKIIISLLLLIVAAAVIYILGLIQLAVPRGSWAVIETKTGGVEENVIEGGTWNWVWRWEKVLPTVMTIHLFRPEIYKIELENPIKGQIFPSAGDYTTALEGNPDFSFEVFYYLEFSIIPGILPELVKSGVRPETIGTWAMELSKKLGERISRIILSDPSLLYDREFNNKMKGLLIDDPDFHFLNIVRLLPQKINLPDYDLYLLAKENYFKLQELNFRVRELKIQQDLEKLAKEHQRNLESLDKEMEIINNIEKYGALLSDYPVLIRFLYMRNIKEEDFLKLSQFRLQTEE